MKNDKKKIVFIALLVFLVVSVFLADARPSPDPEQLRP